MQLIALWRYLETGLALEGAILRRLSRAATAQ
jgi:hypothetical protein